MNNNEHLIYQFYSAFQNKDYVAMQACYADNARFSDNAFVNLNAHEVRTMWHMLIKGGGNNLRISFENIKADKNKGSCNWTAEYVFSLTGRKVTNHIQAYFDFENGKIVSHKDHFDFWKWSRQAFGLKGLLLGWTPFFRNKVQATAGNRLSEFIKKNSAN